jgi:hypothetical protein
VLEPEDEEEGEGLVYVGEARPTLADIEALDRAVTQAVQNLQKLQVRDKYLFAYLAKEFLYIA